MSEKLEMWLWVTLVALALCTAFLQLTASALQRKASNLELQIQILEEQINTLEQPDRACPYDASMMGRIA